MKKSRLTILVIAVLGVIIVAGLLVVYVMHMQDGTTTNVGNHMVAFSSSRDGISFKYPDSYVLTSHHEGASGAEWRVNVLTDKAAASAIPAGSEGPPAITVSGAFKQPANGTLDEWIKTSPYSNFNLSSDKVLRPSLVGGEQALAYTHSGLYEFDAVAVLHKGNVYLFEAGWLTREDTIHSDFQNLLNTVQFIQ